MAFRDIGEKMTGTMMVEPKKAPEVYYQKINLDDRQLPEIETWEVGQEYELVFRVYLCEKSMTEEEGEPKEMTGKFELRAVQAEEEEPASDLNEASNRVKSIMKKTTVEYGG